MDCDGIGGTTQPCDQPAVHDREDPPATPHNPYR